MVCAVGSSEYTCRATICIVYKHCVPHRLMLRISEERLANILSNPKAVAYFQTLDVDVTESAALFHLIDNGDGEAG